MTKTRLIELLTGNQVKLSKSDLKIAEVVRKSPEKVIHLSIAKLAEIADVSEPTINRLCHKLGCNGYPDFKLRLAQEISSNTAMVVENMEISDDTQTVMSKILTSIENSVRSITQSTSPASVDAATHLLCQSRTIYFFGMGASGPVALDAQHKFFRFGIPVVAQTDYINQRMMCAMLSEQDVAVFISYTGRTKAIIECAEIARESGAQIIGLTRQDSPLSRVCNVVLNATTTEDTDLFTPMTSRIIHLALIDILATRMAIELGESVEANIRAIKNNLSETRQPG